MKGEIILCIEILGQLELLAGQFQSLDAVEAIEPQFSVPSLPKHVPSVLMKLDAIRLDVEGMLLATVGLIGHAENEVLLHSRQNRSKEIATRWYLIYNDATAQTFVAGYDIADTNGIKHPFLHLAVFQFLRICDVIA